MFIPFTVEPNASNTRTIGFVLHFNAATPPTPAEQKRATACFIDKADVILKPLQSSVEVEEGVGLKIVADVIALIRAVNKAGGMECPDSLVQ
jgi:hypothetical protein